MRQILIFASVLIAAADISTAPPEEQFEVIDETSYFEDIPEAEIQTDPEPKLPLSFRTLTELDVEEAVARLEQLLPSMSPELLQSIVEQKSNSLSVSLVPPAQQTAIISAALAYAVGEHVPEVAQGPPAVPRIANGGELTFPFLSLKPPLLSLPPSLIPPPRPSGVANSGWGFLSDEWMQHYLVQPLQAAAAANPLMNFKPVTTPQRRLVEEGVLNQSPNRPESVYRTGSNRPKLTEEVLRGMEESPEFSHEFKWFVREVANAQEDVDKLIKVVEEYFLRVRPQRIARRLAAAAEHSFQEHVKLSAEFLTEVVASDNFLAERIPDAYLRAARTLLRSLPQEVQDHLMASLRKLSAAQDDTAFIRYLSEHPITEQDRAAALFLIRFRELVRTNKGLTQSVPKGTRVTRAAERPAGSNSAAEQNPSAAPAPSVGAAHPVSDIDGAARFLRGFLIPKAALPVTSEGQAQTPARAQLPTYDEIVENDPIVRNIEDNLKYTLKLPLQFFADLRNIW